MPVYKTKYTQWKAQEHNVRIDAIFRCRETCSQGNSFSPSQILETIVTISKNWPFKNYMEVDASSCFPHTYIQLFYITNRHIRKQWLSHHYLKWYLNQKRRSFTPVSSLSIRLTLRSVSPFWGKFLSSVICSETLESSHLWLTWITHTRYGHMYPVKLWYIGPVIPILHGSKDP